MKIWIGLILCIWIATARAAVKDPVYDEFEGLDLAEVLVRDGRLDAAERALKPHPASDRKWLVSGQLAAARGSWPEAIESYRKARPSPRREVLLGRALHQAGRFEEGARHFAQSAGKWLEEEGDAIAKAACEDRSGNSLKALETLLEAEAKRSSAALVREATRLHVKLSLIRVGFEFVTARAERHSPAEILGFAEVFHQAGAKSEALAVVELARLRAPYDPEVNLTAAQAYFQKGNLAATAEAFERAARTDSTYAFASAEIRRQLGHRQTAVFHSQFVAEEKERLKSRLAGYVDGSQYGLIASLAPIINRSRLKEDDEVQYALAYSLMRQGDLERPMKHLARIQRPEFQVKAALLKKAILDCKTSGASCRL